MTNWLRFPEQIASVPFLEGVYLLGDSLGNVIYVGRTDNLRERLGQHPDPKNICLSGKRIYYFAFETSNNSELLERVLINRYKPTCNLV